MRVVFRADASNQIGSGHVQRCLTLAESLGRRGASTRFICRKHTGDLSNLLRRRDQQVTLLPFEEPSDSRIGEGSWLGSIQEADARATIESLAEESADLVIVDHYGLDVAWEHLVRPHVGRLMVIDDLADRRHDCDVLLDQNYGRESGDEYGSLVTADCRLLLGPRYALLGPEYRARRSYHHGDPVDVERVLISFGGADTGGLTEVALEAMATAELEDLTVDVVVGPANHRRKAIVQRARGRGATVVHAPREHLADLMAQADIGLGAGGMTTWERMNLGLPSVVVSVASNQERICDALERDGLIRHVGRAADVTAEQLRDAVFELRHDAVLLRKLSLSSWLSVDGYGALRVSEVVLPTTKTQLKLRPARADDIDVYFGWVNDPLVRQQAVTTKPISWDDHVAWLNARLESAASHMFVLDAMDLPIGQIRFDLSAAEATISFSLDASVRGRGLARWLLERGMEDLERTVEPIRYHAQVRRRNAPSLAAFEGLDFERCKADDAFVWLSRPSLAQKPASPRWDET